MTASYSFGQTALMHDMWSSSTPVSAAPTEDHGEKDDHTPRVIAAETVLTGSGRDVRK